MTMSETVVQMSQATEKIPPSPTENGFSVGQEVNKAKDEDDSAGGSFPSESDRSRNGVGDSELSEDQSPHKMKNRRGISFPKDSFVSGYLEPPDPWKNAPKCTNQELIAAYKKSCEKHATKPMNKVMQQLETFSCSGKREERFILKGEKIDCKHCETLEEVFRRVQFKIVDLESCHLDDECAVALFDMIEYYDSACTLNIAFNKNIGLRGWQACSRLIRRTPSLTALDMRNCDLNDRSIPVFGRALKLGSHLTVLHMENMYLSGRALIILVAALKMNEILQELFLADNRLMPSDGIHLGNLLKYNHTLILFDLRNNHLQDVGVGHVCDGLYEQNLDHGLRTLVLWNNQMTYQAMASLSRALGSTKCLETLNLGHNNVTNEGIHILKEGLLKSKSLMRLGLQSTRLTCEGAVALAEYVADSQHLLRLDLRENDIKTAGLMALSLALKVNSSVTRMDLDRETKKESGMKDYADQQRRLQQEINGYLERNQKLALEREEEERRLLEERAQVQVAKQEVQSIIHSAQEMLQASPEMLFAPPPEMRRRPSLLFDAAILSPQESLESPLCTDAHPFFPLPESSLASPVIIPQVSVSSPPMSLDLQHPLTAAPTSLEVAPDMGDGVVLPMPLPSTLKSAPVLSSPPVELLLSPQYYPKPTARKIFSVSRVIETAPMPSPTVSKTGVLDTGPPVIPDSSLLLASSAGIVVNPDTINTVSPTLLCQDLAVKTVNTIIEQLVSDISPTLLLAPNAALSIESHALVEQIGVLHNGQRTKGFSQDGASAVLQASLGVAGDGNIEKTAEESDSPASLFDPLGVLRSPPTHESKRVGVVVNCDSLKASPAETDREVHGDVCGELTVSDGSCENKGEVAEVVSTSEEGDHSESVVETVTDSNVEAKAGSGMSVMNDSDIPKTNVASDASDTSAVACGGMERVNSPDVEEPVSDESRESSSVVSGAAEHLVDDLETEILSEMSNASGHIARREKAHDSTVKEGASKDASQVQLSDSEFDIHPTDSLLLINKGGHTSRVSDPSLWNNMDFSDFSLDDEDLSLFGAVEAQLAANNSSSKSVSQVVSTGDQPGAVISPEDVHLESSTDVGTVLSDTWLTVDAASLAEQQKEGAGEKGTGDKPDFFTALTFNGLTQELASALSSIDESGTGADDQELHTPDEFERELDALLASVKSDLPWPLQLDSPVQGDSEGQATDTDSPNQSARS